MNGSAVAGTYTPRVFLSYAREDFESAVRLARELTAEGFAPWFDKDNLLPGERWKKRSSVQSDRVTILSRCSLGTL